ncbi:MAG: M28 family peptidase, partial [Candidatus Hodarchaeota archaeon]
MIEQALGMVSIGRLYNHIMALEGIRHPLDSYAALIQAGEYIETRFKQYSLETERHQFSIEGFNQPFFNIIGYLDRKIKKQDSIPRVIVTSHYDTVFRSPGADDNASAIAVMLEIAQILKKLDYDHPTQFISFNLEEGSPLIQLKIREIGQRYNVFDQSFRHTSYIIKKYREQYFHKTFHSRSGKFFLDEEEWNEFQEVSTKEL